MGAIQRSGRSEARPALVRGVLKPPARRQKMNPLKGWTMAASFVFVALIAVLFGYSGRGPEQMLLVQPASVTIPPAAPAESAPARQAEPQSNEVPDFQQLD
jgi:hypothetical protein